MKYGMYVIFDKVAKEAGFPFDAKNDDVAKRRFEDIINRQIRPVKTVSVDDYELCFVGVFDSEQCKLIPGFDVDDTDFVCRHVCDGSEVNMWSQEEIDKLNSPSPTFDMEAFSKKVGQITADFAKANQSMPKKLSKKWFFKK